MFDTYFVVDTFDGELKKCTKEQAQAYSYCDDYFVITPTGKWLCDEAEEEPRDA